MPESLQESPLTALGFQNLADDVWDGVVSVCERFEQDWSAESRIEGYLDGSEGAARRFRLFKLLEIDLEKRHARGERPRGQDYLQRFPGEETLIAAAFQEAGLPFGGDAADTDLGATARIQATGNATAPAAPAAGPWPKLAGYELLEQIGQGGMGVVYKARQKKPDRVVAIKMIKASHATSPEARRRFDIEVQAAGRLRHPNIVALHEYGEADGQPYFSMDFISGRSLDELRRDPVPPRQAAKIVKTVALAIQYAHDQGLLHRDLKPSNILIDESDQPYVTDFGLAKAFTADETHVTATGEVLGTPAYMPPEQAEGTLERIDRRSDVYSLGAILYALLAGRPPFTAANRIQMIRQVIHDDPVPLRRLTPGLPRDLETICLKCLEKPPSRRYQSAQDLADDLDRFLRGEPTRARPAGVVGRTVRWTRRNKWRAAATALGFAAIVLVAGLAITQTLAARRERRSRTRTESLLRLAEARQASLQYEKAIRALGVRDMEAAKRDLYGVPASQQGLEGKLLRWRLLGQPKAEAALVDDYFGIIAVAASPDAKRLVTAYATGTVLVWDLTTGRVQRRLCEGRWDEEARRRLHHFEARPEKSKVVDWGPCYTALAWLPTIGSVAGVSLDGTVAVFDVEQGTIRKVAQLGEPLYALAATAEGSSLVSGGRSGKLYAVSITAGQEPRTLDGSAAITAMTALPDRKHCLVGRADGTLQLVAMADLAVRANFQVSGTVWSIAARAGKNGWLAAVASGAPEIALVTVPRDAAAIQSGATLRPPETVDQPFVCHAVGFGKRGDRVYAVDSRGQMTSWELATKKVDSNALTLIPERLRSQLDQAAKKRGMPEGLPPPLQRVASYVGEAPDGNRLITAGDDGAVKLWPASPARGEARRALVTNAGKSPRLSFDAEHPGLVWTLDQTGRLCVIDCQADKLLASQKAHVGGAAGLARISKAGLMVSVGGDSAVHFWRLENGEIRSGRGDIRHHEPLISVTASPDGRWIAAVDVAARLIVWDLDSGKQVFLTELSGHSGGPVAGAAERPLTGRVAFNLDGSRLSAFGSDQTACLFETAPFRRLPEQIKVAGNGGMAMIWSPALPGAVIAADDFPRYSVLALDGQLADRTEPYNLAPESTCVAMGVTPDGRRVVLAERAGLLSFLDAEHFVRVVNFHSAFHTIADLAIDPHADRLAVAEDGGAIEVWEAEAASSPEKPQWDDAKDAWSSSCIVEPAPYVMRTCPRMIQADADGRIGLLYVESQPRDGPDDGALYFVKENEGYTQRQQLVVGDGTHARRARFDAAALVFGPTGEPTVAFRLRSALKSPYDGSIHLGQRTAPSEWTYQTIHQHGNMGFYPALRLDRAGRPAELLHFSFAGCYLVRSTPGDGTADEWNTQLIGEQGDGMRLTATGSPIGTLNMIFRRNRFNNDPAPPIFARWDGQQLDRQVIDPFDPVSEWEVALAPDGAPVVLVGKQLLRLTPAGWVQDATLPPVPAESMAINREGEVYLVGREDDNQRVVLCQGRQNSWSAKTIAQFADDTPPNICILRLGPNGEPVIVVACINKPYGWVRVLRRKG